jgi:hypothetical protein
VEVLAVSPAFYSTVALLLPVLFLAAVVELRLSAAVESPQGEKWDDLAMRVLVGMLAGVALVNGEAICVVALYVGPVPRFLAQTAGLTVLWVGAAVVLPVFARLRLEVSSAGEDGGRALGLAVRIACVAAVACVVPILVWGVVIRL